MFYNIITLHRNVFARAADSLAYMESARRRVTYHVVGVLVAGGVYAVDDRAGLPDETQSLPVHVHYVHHLDRHQLIHRILDVGGVW